MVRDVLCRAIQERHIVRFTYHGYSRTVVPAAFGLSSAKNLVLRGYQTEGGSQSGRRVPFWTLYRVSDMQALVDTGIRFETAPVGYKPGDKGISDIYAEL
jgi:hypothetical protein